jgi:hypothetical protein
MLRRPGSARYLAASPSIRRDAIAAYSAFDIPHSELASALRL